jgi:hypothetical protein
VYKESLYLLRATRYKKNKKMDFLKDLFNFLRERKKFWLAPIIIVLLLLGILIIVGGSAGGGLIYTLF